MPFTPIHLGPGAFFKAVGGNHFSFMVFAGAQVLMDIEPLLGIIQGKAILHGYTHTVLGALLIGSLAGLLGKPISTMVLRMLRIRHRPLTWIASLMGAYVGTFSHIALDTIMHSDMNPLWPIRSGNPSLRIISIDSLHLLCFALALIGMLIIATKAWLAHRNQ